MLDKVAKAVKRVLLAAIIEIVPRAPLVRRNATPMDKHARLEFDSGRLFDVCDLLYLRFDRCGAYMDGCKMFWLYVVVGSHSRLESKHIV